MHELIQRRSRNLANFIDGLWRKVVSSQCGSSGLKLKAKGQEPLYNFESKLRIACFAAVSYSKVCGEKTCNYRR
jgi:hypothetical protein